MQLSPEIKVARLVASESEKTLAALFEKHSKTNSEHSLRNILVNMERLVWLFLVKL